MEPNIEVFKITDAYGVVYAETWNQAMVTLMELAEVSAPIDKITIERTHLTQEEWDALPEDDEDEE